MIYTFQLKNKAVSVSKQDKHLIDSYAWRIIPARQIENKWYVAANINNKTVYLHRLIMGNPKGKVIDHIDRNPLNCTRDNLRVVSHSVNRLNCEVRKNKKSCKYKGVFKDKRPRKNPYNAVITYRKKRIQIGSYPTAKAASIAYQNKFKQLYPAI